jgi:hypothetical protein
MASRGLCFSTIKEKITMNAKKHLLLGMALACTAVTAFAQVSRTMTFGFDNPAVMSLDIDRNAVSFKLPPNFSGEARDLPNAVTIVVKSNVPWVLTAGVNADFRALESAGNTIPSERMEYRCRIKAAVTAASCQEEYQPLVKNQSLEVARGGTTPNEGVVIVTDYHLKITLQDPAGTYTMPITYTLSPVQ